MYLIVKKVVENKCGELKMVFLKFLLICLGNYLKNFIEFFICLKLIKINRF